MRIACLSFLLGCALACDPKAGFESAAGAIDPNQKSYVDGPGTRLAAGAFTTIGIDFDLDTQVHLLARRRDDQGTSMTLFGQDAQSGCTISPNSATWFATKPANDPYRLLPFFESRDANGMGTLRFASIDCKVEPYSLDNSLGPTDPELNHGFLVRQGGGLVLADPWNATTTPIVADLRRLIQLGSAFLVWGDAQIIAFDDDLSELGRFGNHVVAVSDLDYGTAFAVEDDDGVHLLTMAATGRDFSFKILDADACALSSGGGELGMIAVHSPCNDGHLVAESVDPTGATDVQREAFKAEGDSRFANIIGYPAPGMPLSSLTAFYLEDVDPATGLGTLFAAQPKSGPVRLGSNAELERTYLLGESHTWGGVALVSVQAGLGDLVRWSWDGTEETLAQNVDRSASGGGFMANYDGHAGDVLSLDSEGNPTIVQTGSPAFNTTLLSGDYVWGLRLEHFDGVSGDLTFANGLGTGYATTARGVPPNQYQFTTLVPLPGFAYLGTYDPKALTGTLFVQNIELGSTSTVARNVSDFVATNYPLPGILYTVPAGQNAGIWFARAK